MRTDEQKRQAKLRTQQKKKRSKNKSKNKQTQKPVGRPAGSTNKNKAELVLNPELLRILAQAQKLLKLISKKVNICYFVLDGHFGNRCAGCMVRQLDLHIISKMRANAALYLEPTADQKHKQPRLKYGTRLDYANLPEDRLCSCTTEDGYCTQVYQAKCLHKDFAEPLNVVIVVKTHLLSGGRGHVVLFSTDLSLGADILVDYYSWFAHF